MAPSNVHILHPTSPPLAGYLRVGHTGHHKLAALHAADRPGSIPARLKVDLSGLAQNRTTTDSRRRRESGIYGRWYNVAGLVRVGGSPIQRRVRREAQSTQRRKDWRFARWSEAPQAPQRCQTCCRPYFISLRALRTSEDSALNRPAANRTDHAHSGRRRESDIISAGISCLVSISASPLFRGNRPRSGGMSIIQAGRP